MPNSKIDGDLFVTGTLQPTLFNAPASCIGDQNVNGSSPLQVSKSYQQYKRSLQQDYQAAAVAASSKPIIHVAQAAGSVYLIRAGLVVPCLGAAIVTIDLKKNGASILSSVLTLNLSGIAYITSSGLVAVANYVANDVFELTIVATAGGGTLGQGLFVDTVFRELPG